MDTIIPEKKRIIDNMLKIYNSIDKSNEYDIELNELENQLKEVEDKKTLALDLVFSGEIKKEELKVQFKKYEADIEELNIKKGKLLNQINILNENQNNIEKIGKSIQEEIEGGSLEEFIRKFVDEVIVSKIDNDRYNVKLDIYLNLLGDEKPKIKGARHIDGATDEDILYLENQFCETIEVKRSIDTPNKFTYDVYVESL